MKLLNELIHQSQEMNYTNKTDDIARKKMSPTELKKILPLYTVLSELVLGFLDPCFDYSTPKCRHKKAFCRCGNEFEFRESRFIHSERILLENFCPFCGTPNPHKTRILENEPPFLVRTKNYLKCICCSKHAESYDHKFCSTCQHKLDWVSW